MELTAIYKLTKEKNENHKAYYRAIINNIFK